MEGGTLMGDTSVTSTELKRVGGKTCGVVASVVCNKRSENEH